MSVLNFDNTNYLTGHYPLFLGEDLGMNDEINVTYPEIAKIKDLHMSQFWLATEISFEDDRLDMKDAPKSESDVMILNLLAQHALDSLASRSIIELFGPLVSNTELHSWFLTQSFFEDIHASTYSKIMRNAFVNPNESLERGMTNLNVFNRTKVIGKVFNEMKQITGRYMNKELSKDNPDDVAYMKKHILKSVFTLYSLEQISFMASFACTFALSETGRYQGISKALGLIASDEILHAKGDLVVFKEMIKDPEYKAIFEENKHEYQEIFEAVTQQELDWADYIFSEGRKVLGLNTPLLKEYVNYVAYPCFKNLGFEWDEDKFGEVPPSNPLPFMDKHLDRDSVQTAPQEIQINNYRVGQLNDDLGNELLDF